MAFFIWFMLSAAIALMGVYALLAKKPVHFWTVKQKLEVSDVRRYNRAVAVLWFVFAVVIAVLGIPLLAGQNSPWVILSILGLMWAAILTMVIYTRIEKKYRV